MKTKAKIVLFIFIFFVTEFFGLFAPHPKAQPSQSSDTVIVVIPDTTILSSSTFAIPVEIRSLQQNSSIFSFEFILSFDNLRYSCDSIYNNGCISSEWGPPYYNIISDSGKILIALAGTSALTGQGAVLYIKLTALEPGNEDTTYLNFDKILLNEGIPPVSGKNGKIRFVPSGVDDEDEALPYKETILFQNYPNPFNPDTYIDYYLVSSSKVNLCIYNLLGQKVITLVDQFEFPGQKIIKWDGKDFKGEYVSSGIYFYKLTVGNNSQTKRMVFLK